MTYDPSHPTRLDEIRFLVFDTAEPPLVPDETIHAALVSEDDWRLAAATIAEGVAVQLERRVTNVTMPGEMAVGWGDRARSLRALAARWRAEVAADRHAAQAGGMSTVRLTRSDLVDTAPEYTRRRVRGV